MSALLSAWILDYEKRKIIPTLKILLYVTVFSCFHGHKYFAIVIFNLCILPLNFFIIKIRITKAEKCKPHSLLFQITVISNTSLIFLAFPSCQNQFIYHTPVQSHKTS